MHWYEAVSAALNFPFLKEISQNCFLAGIAPFFKVSTLKNEEVSQNCFVLDVVNFEK